MATKPANISMAERARPSLFRRLSGGTKRGQPQSQPQPQPPSARPPQPAGPDSSEEPLREPTDLNAIRISAREAPSAAPSAPRQTVRRVDLGPLQGTEEYDFYDSLSAYEPSQKVPSKRQQQQRKVDLGPLRSAELPETSARLAEGSSRKPSAQQRGGAVSTWAPRRCVDLGPLGGSRFSLCEDSIGLGSEQASSKPSAYQQSRRYVDLTPLGRGGSLDDEAYLAPGMSLAEVKEQIERKVSEKMTSRRAIDPAVLAALPSTELDGGAIAAEEPSQLPPSQKRQSRLALPRGQPPAAAPAPSLAETSSTCWESAARPSDMRVTEAAPRAAGGALATLDEAGLDDVSGGTLVAEEPSQRAPSRPQQARRRRVPLADEQMETLQAAVEEAVEQIERKASEKQWRRRLTAPAAQAGPVFDLASLPRPLDGALYYSVWAPYAAGEHALHGRHLADALQFLATWHRKHGRLRQAEDNLKRVLELKAAPPLFPAAHRPEPPPHSELADTLNDLGLVHLKQGRGRLAEAEGCFEEALQLRLYHRREGDDRRTVFQQRYGGPRGPPDPDTAVAFNNLALVRLKQRRLVAAEDGFRRALEEQRSHRHGGLSAPLELAYITRNLATCHQLQGRHERAGAPSCPLSVAAGRAPAGPSGPPLLSRHSRGAAERPRSPPAPPAPPRGRAVVGTTAARPRHARRWSHGPPPLSAALRLAAQGFELADLCRAAHLEERRRLAAADAAAAEAPPQPTRPGAAPPAAAAAAATQPYEYEYYNYEYYEEEGDGAAGASPRSPGCATAALAAITAPAVLAPQSVPQSAAAPPAAPTPRSPLPLRPAAAEAAPAPAPNPAAAEYEYAYEYHERKGYEDYEYYYDDAPAPANAKPTKA